jgi:hypothetical protein
MGSISANKQAYVGKSWLSGKDILTIDEVNEKTFHVQTRERNGIRFTSAEEFEDFFTGLKEAPAVGQMMIVDGSGSDIMANLLNGLVNDFKKLETDPAYVGQAKQRSNQVNTAINLVKLRLEMNRQQPK